MVKKLTITAFLALVAVAAHAQGFNLQALQQQLATTPAGQAAMQQTQAAVMQQAMQQMAANPQLLTQMANSLTPAQQATLMQQAMTAGQRIFTPAEQAKLTAFTSSPEGASIAAKLPQLVQALAPTLLQMYAGQAGTLAPAAGK
jgi:hypothetical protein